jgi:hypothetical protein
MLTVAVAMVVRGNSSGQRSSFLRLALVLRQHSLDGALVAIGPCKIRAAHLRCPGYRGPTW